MINQKNKVNTMLNKIINICLSLVFLIILNLFGSINLQAEGQQSQIRIVTLGGTITETIYAIGAGNMIVGTDVSSIYPAEANKLPKVGYWRRLSPEGVLSLKPTHVIATYDAGPPDVLAQFEKAGVKVVKLPAVFTFEQVKSNINLIAKSIGKDKEAITINNNLDKDYKAISSNIKKLATKPNALFLYLRNGKILDAGGKNTPADGMISIAGGNNIASSLDGWKTVTSEFFLTSQPDVIIVTKSGLESAGGLDALKNIPGLSATPAVKSNNILVLDDIAFLGFGPRFCESLSETVKAFSKVKKK
jgi:iron complex transport system substrate-binding protein